MMSSPKSCVRCGAVSLPGTNCCALHQTPLKRNRDAVDQRYGHSEWYRFRKWMLAQFPVCQRINNGVRCMNPSKIGHHLWSPRVRPDLFTDPTNVVLVCALCHPNEEGTPYWRKGVDYTDDFDVKT